MPDMPPDTNVRACLLGCLVNRFVGVTQTVRPQHFPREQFRIPQHQAPETDVVPVHRTSAAATSAYKLLEFLKTLLRTHHADSRALPRFSQNSQKQVTRPGSL